MYILNLTLSISFNNTMSNIFNEHPKSVNETYIQHLIIALKFSVKLFVLFVIAFVHAILPFLFKTTVSKKIIEMANDLQKRN